MRPAETADLLEVTRCLVSMHVNRSRSVTWLGSAQLLLSWIAMQEIHLPHPLCPPGNRRFRRRSAPVISTLGS